MATGLSVSIVLVHRDELCLASRRIAVSTERVRAAHGAMHEHRHTGVCLVGKVHRGFASADRLEVVNSASSLLPHLLHLDVVIRCQSPLLPQHDASSLHERRSLHTQHVFETRD